jgi:hypothetical protein
MSLPYLPLDTLTGRNKKPQSLDRTFAYTVLIRSCSALIEGGDSFKIPISKSQIPNSSDQKVLFGNSDFDHWCLFGIWCLVFGIFFTCLPISASPYLFLKGGSSVHRSVHLLGGGG